MARALGARVALPDSVQRLLPLAAVAALAAAAAGLRRLGVP